LAEIAAREPIEVLAEVDDAHRVDQVGIEPAVDRHHGRTGSEQVVGNRFQERLGQTVIDRGVGHVEDHRLETGFLGALKLLGRVGGDQDLGVAGEALEPRPVGGAVEQEQHGLDLGHLRKLNRRGVKRLETVGEPERLHPGRDE
jgi:hypothetical protein